MWEDPRAAAWRRRIRVARIVAWTLLVAAVVALGILGASNSGWAFLAAVALFAGAGAAFNEVGTCKGRLERPARKAERRAAKAERRRRALERARG